jgi:hypothetical protein
MEPQTSPVRKLGNRHAPGLYTEVITASLPMALARLIDEYAHEWRFIPAVSYAHYVSGRTIRFLLFHFGSAHAIGLLTEGSNGWFVLWSNEQIATQYTVKCQGTARPQPLKLETLLSRSESLLNVADHLRGTNFSYAKQACGYIKIVHDLTSYGEHLWLQPDGAVHFRDKGETRQLAENPFRHD